jgi:hypothetical protein
MNFLGALLSSFLSLTLLASPVYTVRVQEVTGGRELGTMRAAEGDRIQVQYVHSMYHVKQEESFLIGPDLRFHLEKVTFGSFAAALYYGAEDASSQNGVWTVRGVGKKYDFLKYRVGTGTQHVLLLGDQRMELTPDDEWPGEVIEIRLQRQEGN